MISDPIFKRDSTGNVRSWQYEVDGPQYRTIAGLLNGQKVTSGWTVCTPKSQPTAEEQAIFEAGADEKKKLERDYHRDIKKIDEPIFFKPMLAQTYAGCAFPVYIQPKLDGVRCIATAKGLFSRQGKRFFGIPHIERALKLVFIHNPTAIFDGELYNHDLKEDFNKIVSLVKKQNPTEEQLQKSAELIQFHIYDLPSQHGIEFGIRQTALSQVVKILQSPHLVAVETVLVGNQEAMDENYGLWLEAGYEGQIIRLDAPYEQKRSKHLLKRKEFVTEEFPISRIGEGQGNWASYAKWVEFILPGDRRLENGERPRAGIRGNQAFTAELLQQKDAYVGKPTTIRFFGYTPAGIPRFPVAVDFDRID